ncbi:hypothetical protein UFOVP1384_37 [uncultured Caudovirales phage]|uniref:Lipoprotein n=1 Tax=uncultured Caudovirales phage TaxID=2100421 RepID=A0A6J5S6R1_9CAUD|nr:hypothetical protein UFOVP1384_37 [uncultured Caudovirales phage]
MLRVFSWFVAFLLLGGCYTQFKATKQVSKALANYPQIVAKIALDSFPCDVIRIDTVIYERDTIMESYPVETTLVDTFVITKKLYVKLPYKTIYITKVVESTAKLAINKASLDSSNNVISELQKSNDKLTKKVASKNKAIWWFIALVVGLLLPYVIHIFKLLNIKI